MMAEDLNDFYSTGIDFITGEMIPMRRFVVEAARFVKSRASLFSAQGPLVRGKYQ